MRSKKPLASLALFGALLLVSADASAERKKRERSEPSTEEGAAAGEGGETREGASSERDDWIPYALRDDVELSARWWSASLYGSTFAFDLRGQTLVDPNVGIAFTFPWVFNAGNAADTVLGALGNPTIDVYYVARAGIVTWHVGGGLSAPLASIDDPEYRAAATVGYFTLAAYDGHLYIPTYMPLRAFGGVEIRPNHIMSVRLGLSPDFLIPIEGNDFEVALQEYADLIALGDAGFGGGVRLQGVHPLTGGGDHAQMSLEPYLAYDDRESFFAKVGFLMALDTPLGFAFDTRKVAALHLGIGGYLDGSGGDSF